MKKLLAILLVCVFAFSVVACNGSDDESSAGGFTNSNTSKPESSSTPESSAEESSEPSESSESSEVSEPSNEIEEISQFISWENPYYKGITNVTKKSAKSLVLHKLNADVAEGENGVFTREYGTTIKCDGQDYADYAVVVFEYDHSNFGYIKKSLSKAGEADAETAIPEDGWVTVIWKDNAEKIDAVDQAPFDTVYFPHGFVPNPGLDATISKCTSAPVIDGKADAGEYGEAVWVINPENEFFSYAQFEKDNYNATANAYITYDAENLYFALVVDTPDHYNTSTQTSNNDLWKQTCIQLAVTSIDPHSEEMTESIWDFDRGVTDARDNNIYRQYCLAVNDEGENIKLIYFGSPSDPDADLADSCVTRVGQTTTYEIAIPWEQLGDPSESIDVSEGTVIGVAFSINSGTKEREFQNITMRDGGSAIGTNDFTKVPAITLG